MKREEVLAMQAGPAMDALVAEKVMGWTLWRSPCARQCDQPDCWKTGKRVSPTIRIAGWNPSREVQQDYEVLQHVRKHWEVQKQDAFRRELDDILEARYFNSPNRDPDYWVSTIMFYEPGDYARAALLAMD